MANSVKLKEPNTYIDASGVYDFESKMTQEEINALFTNGGAGTHNSIYRGKFLGTSVTPEQWEAIANGTFKGLYIGDYWTINGVNWRNAMFDPFLNCGDVPLTKHHSLILPDTCLYNAKMNESDTTTGGYVGSAMYKSGLSQAKQMIKAAFGEHVLRHRLCLTNAVANGCASGGAWYDSETELMCEQMAYGGSIFSPVSDGSSVPYNYRLETSQLPLFRYNPDLICTGENIWLRDVITASHFAFINNDGSAGYVAASSSLGVRPYFCIGVVEV